MDNEELKIELHKLKSKYKINKVNLNFLNYFYKKHRYNLVQTSKSYHRYFDQVSESVFDFGQVSDYTNKDDDKFLQEILKISQNLTNTVIKQTTDLLYDNLLKFKKICDQNNLIQELKKINL
jgi:hypothetical protein